MNQILKRQTSRSHYGSKVPAVTITVFKYRNKIGKIVVKAVPYSVTSMGYRKKNPSWNRCLTANKYLNMCTDQSINMASYEIITHWQLPNREHYKNSQTSQTLVAFLVRFTLHVRETSLFFHIKLYSGYTCVLITVSTPVNLIWSIHNTHI